MFGRFLVGAQLTLAASAALASPLFVSYDNFNYAGTVTRYGSLADAQAGTNASGSATPIATASNGSLSTLPNARDGQVYFASGAAGYDPTDLSYFSTAWYFTTTPADGDGWGNPNNTNTGFVQYYNASAAPVVSGGWSNANTRFSLNVSGGDGDSADHARLWAAPVVGGASSDTAGVFREFQLNLVADFAVAAALDSATGWYRTDDAPDSLTAGATGIFENQSVNSSLNGFYAFDFTFARGSWAADNGATWDAGGQTQYAPQALFAAPGATVPEPASLALLGIALLALTTVRSRRT